jgi:hypothetical protein
VGIGPDVKSNQTGTGHWNVVRVRDADVVSRSDACYHSLTVDVPSTRIWPCPANECKVQRAKDEEGGSSSRCKRARDDETAVPLTNKGRRQRRVREKKVASELKERSGIGLLVGQTLSEEQGEGVSSGVRLADATSKKSCHSGDGWGRQRGHYSDTAQAQIVDVTLLHAVRPPCRGLAGERESGRSRPAPGPLGRVLPDWCRPAGTGPMCPGDWQSRELGTKLLVPAVPCCCQFCALVERARDVGDEAAKKPGRLFAGPLIVSDGQPSGSLG